MHVVKLLLVLVISMWHTHLQTSVILRFSSHNLCSQAIPVTRASRDLPPMNADASTTSCVPHDVFSMIVDCGTPSRHPITFCIRALAGQLVDTFRHFNPLPTYHPTNTTAQHPEHAVNPAAANYTWRGCEGKNNPMSAKYYKKVRVV